MKNVLKFGVLALALGFFATACNSGTNNNNNDDSSNLEMSAPDNQVAPAPMDTSTLPMDTTGTDTTGLDTSGM